MAAQRSARPGPRQRARQGPVNRISEHDNARGARMTRTRSYRSNGKRGKIEARAKPGGGPGRPAGAITGAGRPSVHAHDQTGPGRPQAAPGAAAGTGWAKVSTPTIRPARTAPRRPREGNRRRWTSLMQRPGPGDQHGQQRARGRPRRRRPAGAAARATGPTSAQKRGKNAA